MMVKKLFLRNQALIGMPSVIRRALCLLVLVLLGLGPPTQHPHDGHGNAAAGHRGTSFSLLSTAAAAAASDAKEIPIIFTTNDAMDEEDAAALVLSEGTSSVSVVKNVVGGVKAPTTLTTMMTTAMTAMTRLGGRRKQGGHAAGAGGDPLLRDLDRDGTHSDVAGHSGRRKVKEVSTDHDHHERGNFVHYFHWYLC